MSPFWEIFLSINHNKRWPLILYILKMKRRLILFPNIDAVLKHYSFMNIIFTVKSLTSSYVRSWFLTLKSLILRISVALCFFNLLRLYASNRTILNFLFQESFWWWEVLLQCVSDLGSVGINDSTIQSVGWVWCLHGLTQQEDCHWQHPQLCQNDQEISVCVPHSSWNWEHWYQWWCENH